MSRKIIVVAPHPDDETLGCGGTLLKHRELNDQIYWLIITNMQKHAFSQQRIETRNNEIQEVAQHYGFAEVFQLDFPTAELDTVPVSTIVSAIGEVFNQIIPDTVYLPYRGDVHSDHKIVFDASIACTKWFRYPFIKKVMVYETLSETDFGLNTDSNGFRPNIFVNIEDYLEKKIEIMKVFKSELGEFPFPRSELSIRALASVRGTAVGCKAAESFMLLREVF